MSAVPAPLRKTRGASAAARRRPHLRVVQEPVKRHTLLFVLLSLLVAGAAVFLTVSLNAMAAGNAVAARELESRVAEAERTYAQLVADVAELENPARIKRAAIDLGMVAAPAPRYLELQRALPSDGGGDEVVTAGETTDPLKPVLSADR